MTQHCKHGEMLYKSSYPKKNRRAWAGWFCPGRAPGCNVVWVSEFDLYTNEGIIHMNVEAKFDQVNGRKYDPKTGKYEIVDPWAGAPQGIRVQYAKNPDMRRVLNESGCCYGEHNWRPTPAAFMGGKIPPLQELVDKHRWVADWKFVDFEGAPSGMRFFVRGLAKWSTKEWLPRVTTAGGVFGPGSASKLGTWPRRLGAPDPLDVRWYLHRSDLYEVILVDGEPKPTVRNFVHHDGPVFDEATRRYYGEWPEIRRGQIDVIKSRNNFPMTGPRGKRYEGYKSAYDILEFPDVTRVEVITKGGRMGSAWGVKNVRIETQDQGQTLKVFAE